MSQVANCDFTNAEQSLDATLLFQSEIYPLFKRRCFGCHGEGKELEGEFNMLSREGLLAGGASGEPALVPGDPENSPLFQAVLRTGETVMPPKQRNRLTADEIETLKAWIAEKAPWPSKVTESTGEGIQLKTSGGLDESWSNRWYQVEDLWAYLPRQTVSPPLETPDQHPIDAFINAKLAEKKVTPTETADRKTWIRRATFDLLGLPPSPTEVDTFLNDDTAIAFDKVINRLLASPHYGERMAQHWLDVVRYADTAGYANDWERPNAWRYRDYVIRAFNDDKPYDRFITEQLAGDELTELDENLKIAVGFLRMGPWEQTAMSVAAVTRQQYLDDVTNSVGVTFLAQGMSCCKCHDHKFDPLPTRDYYRLQAVFAGTQFDTARTPFTPSENTTNIPRYQSELQKVLDAKDRVVTDDLENNSYKRVTKKYNQYLSRAKKRFSPRSLSVKNDDIHPVHILRGGSLETPLEIVKPGFLSAVDSENLIDVKAVNLPTGRRFALAQWIANPQNPLTARVIVNRVWQIHFGQGIVATPNTFGKMGAKPTHPELLDWLANQLVENGWSIKKLHHLIMTSDTYRRSGGHRNRQYLDKLDPSNHLLAYFPPRRLSAEELRDAMLAVSGELVLDLGGPPVFPEINWEVAFQPRMVMGATAPAYQPSPKKVDRNRRTIYAYRCRTLSDPLLTSFNRPSEDFSCAVRDETTVTPQVFALLNGTNTHARALALATRLQRETDDRQSTIKRLYQLALSRYPNDNEMELCHDHLVKMISYHQQNVPASWPLPTVIEREMIDEMSGKPFRWEERLYNMQNYERDRMPWQVDAETRALSELCLVLLNSNEFIYIY